MTKPILHSWYSFLLLSLLLLLLSTLSGGSGGLLSATLGLPQSGGDESLELLVLDRVGRLDLGGRVPNRGRGDDEGTGRKEGNREEELRDVRSLLGVAGRIKTDIEARTTQREFLSWQIRKSW